MKKVTRSSVKKRASVNKNIKSSGALLTFGGALGGGKNIPTTKEIMDNVNSIDPNVLDQKDMQCGRCKKILTKDSLVHTCKLRD